MSVGVLAPDLSEGYFTRVMSGVVQELTAAHYFYFTACHDWNASSSRSIRACSSSAPSTAFCCSTPPPTTSMYPCRWSPSPRTAR
jgi:DNA-binding LacI/PurR family transcriptional regulator